MILTDINQGLGTISLNRPEKRNALNFEMVGALKAAFTDFFANDSVKVIKLRGEGDVFCAGADLEMLKNLQDATYEENLKDSRHLAELFRIIHEGPKPVVAAVHGHAIAGGCGLASVCDITIAAENAKFGYTETRIGFVPAIVAQFLVRKVGETHARNLLLTGSLIDARQAARIGLISEAVTLENYQQTVHHLIYGLIHKCSGEAMALTKKLIGRVNEISFNEALEEAVVLNAKARGSDDCQYGIKSFLDKKPAIWYAER
ncbi:MAG: enoyl-CoA hydratase/isomerase family protein [Candidatus Cyclonatronum sp.]|uniref:enoyl-CoA hydratase/isomerase family protein n=1 Tax=Cyclonatronum sp. TaxID=3024185 RepID=UPI0025BFDB68|nr:enoyl-CoA hydratase-related protein [Cyclonatronum sp.]MCC5932811.1 enoyl-CoA hydratase/isomerase family protein [Balneolales bacterium]MCH8485601.1 enoyl-CoA hydratase/isomerase family protein [Cyclonatronum sp.]